MKFSVPASFERWPPARKINLIVVSSSLNPASRSAILARYAHQLILEEAVEASLLALEDWNLPFCDGGPCYADENVQLLEKKIARASGMLIAAPIYNFDVNAAVKNFLELTGSGWREKVVGFLCAAGGQSSYMSVMPFANSLMLDFRCFIIPRFVYATGAAFKGNEITDPAIRERTSELVKTLLRLCGAPAEE